MSGRLRILFVCTANAARSQMAEGYFRARYGDLCEVSSAGLRRSTVSPHAIVVMREIGIDISNQRSKTLDDIRDRQFDMAVTLCDSARMICPVVPNAVRTIHHPVSDPYREYDSETDLLAGYRRTRDEIIAWINAAVLIHLF